jgi:hypothetical protein
MKASDIEIAAYRTFLERGNGRYARWKTKVFVQRCGADPTGNPTAEVNRNSVKQVCFAMLDTEARRDFWRVIRAICSEEDD